LIHDPVDRLWIFGKQRYDLPIPLGCAVDCRWQDFVAQNCQLNPLDTVGRQYRNLKLNKS
jgi:hypothetical protein